jgi:hypothetical protein
MDVGADLKDSSPLAYSLGFLRPLRAPLLKAQKTVRVVGKERTVDLALLQVSTTTATRSSGKTMWPLVLCSSASSGQAR